MPGVALYKLGRIEESQKLFEKAFAINPSLVNSQYYKPNKPVKGNRSSGQIKNSSWEELKKTKQSAQQQTSYDAKKAEEEIKKTIEETKKIVNSVEFEISEIKKSGALLSESEELIERARDELNKNNLDKAKELAHKAKSRANQTNSEFESASESIVNAKNALQKAKEFGCDVSEDLVDQAESAFNKGQYGAATKYAKQAEEEIKRLKEEAKPEITVDLSETIFKPDEWRPVELIVTNRGNAHARDVETEFSEEVKLKGLKSLDVNSGEKENLSVYIKPVDVGEVPVEVRTTYRDADGREYNSKQIFVLNVKPSKTERTEESPRTPDQFTPQPTTPRTFPPELSEFYDEVEYLGRGGFARVFKARNKEGKYVAVKIPITPDAATGKSFLREIENWTKLDHENIVKVYDYNVLPIPYFEMELCDHSLADLKKPLDVERAAWITFNVAEGLKFAHNQHLIHRDLKPQNTMFKDGIPKISDWGLSKVMAESESSFTTTFTAYYAAPEQVSGKTKDVRTDIWQLGVIFYEMVTGELPFKGESFVEIGMAVATQQPEQPSKLNPECEEVESIIRKCLQKNPEERYQSVKELQQDLANFLGVKYKESLKLSKSRNDMNRSAYYCGELLILNLRTGEITSAYKFATDLVNYAHKGIKSEAEEFCEQLRYRVENRIEEIPEELMKKAEFVAHKVRIGLG